MKSYLFQVAVVIGLICAVITISSSPGRMYREKGMGLFSDQDFLKAIDQFDTALKLEPNDLISRVYRARCYLSCFRNEKALSDIEKCISAYPDSAELHNMKGVALMRLGLAEQALEEIRTAIVYKPDWAKAYCNLAAIHQGLGNRESSIKCLKTAIALHPASMHYHNYLGCLYLENMETGKAITCFNMAVRLNPEFAPAYNNRGVAYEMNNNNSLAISDYRTAARLDPSMTDSVTNLAWLYMTSRDQRYRNNEAALSLARDTMHLNPKRDLSAFTLAEAHRAGNVSHGYKIIQKEQKNRLARIYGENYRHIIPLSRMGCISL